MCGIYDQFGIRRYRYTAPELPIWLIFDVFYRSAHAALFPVLIVDFPPAFPASFGSSAQFSAIFARSISRVFSDL